MRDPVTARRSSAALSMPDLGNVICVPAADRDFAAAVRTAIRALRRAEPDAPTAVEEALHTRYPDARLVMRDPLAGFDADGGWYALRDRVRLRDTVRRVLVVDDDPATADVIRAALEGRTFEVRCASDGQAALILIAEWSPSLVLLDLRMPRMSGDEFADRYRDLPAPRAPLVVVSVAHDAPMRALRMEARSVVPKPFDLDELVHLVDRYA